MKRWYVVQTQFQGETKAEAHLLNQGFNTYVPRYSKARRHARRVDMVLVPLFPRYIFVQIDLDVQQWKSINGTFGVSRIVSSGEKPMAIKDNVILEIKSRENSDGAVVLKPKFYNKGELLRIVEGSFSDCIGLFEEMADDKRVFLLLDLMGRKVRVKAPIEKLFVTS